MMRNIFKTLVFGVMEIVSVMLAVVIMVGSLICLLVTGKFHAFSGMKVGSRQ